MTDCFQRFPDLAPELRVKIWKFHLYVPRQIRLMVKWYDCEHCDDYDYYKYSEMEGSPALFSVNQESRHESLRCYQHVRRAGACGPLQDFYCEHHQVPEDIDDLVYHDPRRSDIIYINLCLDVIHFSYEDEGSSDGAWFHPLPDRIEHVERTADPIGLINTPYSFTDQLVRDFLQWKSLKSFKLLISFTESDPLVASKYMNEFMTSFEISIHYWFAWRFPKLTVVSQETGIILAERQPCLRNEVQQSYEWKVMGVNIIHRQADTLRALELIQSL